MGRQTNRWCTPFQRDLDQVNPRFYGLRMARRVAWISAGSAVVVALVLGAGVTGWTLWTFVPLVAPFAVRARSRGSVRAPGLVAVAMALEATSIVSAGAGSHYALFVAPILLLCFMTASAIES